MAGLILATWEEEWFPARRDQCGRVAVGRRDSPLPTMTRSSERPFWRAACERGSKKKRVEGTSRQRTGAYLDSALGEGNALSDVEAMEINLVIGTALVVLCSMEESVKAFRDGKKIATNRCRSTERPCR